MTNEQGYKIIGERVSELVKRQDIQDKMIDIASKNGKEAAEKWVYTLAIATLMEGVKTA